MLGRLVSVGGDGQSERCRKSRALMRPYRVPHAKIRKDDVKKMYLLISFFVTTAMYVIEAKNVVNLNYDTPPIVPLPLAPGKRIRPWKA